MGLPGNALLRNVLLPLTPAGARRQCPEAPVLTEGHLHGCGRAFCSDHWPWLEARTGATEVAGCKRCVTASLQAVRPLFFPK